MSHHSAAFTLDRYSHLLTGDQARALDLDRELARVNERHGPQTHLWSSVP